MINVALAGTWHVHFQGYANAVRRDARWHIGASADDAVADALYEIAAAAREQRMPAFMADDGQWEEPTVAPRGVW